MNIYEAMAQAVRDSAPGDVPSVWHRRNRDQWMVTVPMSLLLEFCRRILRSAERCRKDEAA